VNKPALILIDIQQGFYDPVWGRRNNPAFETNVERMLEEWRQKRWPVFHVRHDSAKVHSPLRPGHSGNAFMECAVPRVGECVIVKSVNSAFIGTHLQQLLNAQGSREIMLAGLTTDHCVSTTARMGANLGFDVKIAVGGTATFDRVDISGIVLEAEDVHRVSLASLNNEFAEVIVDINQYLRRFL
jgi:nicotinamidase-related amidase